MNGHTVDPSLLRAWLSGRSYARAVPQPVDDHGGLRVDSNTAAEVVRWVFHEVGPGLERLGQDLRAPHHFLKLCNAEDALRAALPDRWHIHAPNWFMRAHEEPIECPVPVGYRVDLERIGRAIQLRLWSEDGELAASGYAGETADAFVYDRIITAPGHRRRGLGAAMISLLRSARRNHDAVELLVATDEGRALYAALGWHTISPYATASIPNS